MTRSTLNAEAASFSILSAKVWLAPYALVVSTLYLWGYWGTFGINVLDYIGIADIVKAAVYPVLSAFLLVAVGAVLGEVLTSDLKPGGGGDTVIGRWLRKNERLLIVVFAGIFIAVLFSDWVHRWLVLSVFLAGPVYLRLKTSSLLSKEIPSDGARSVIIFLLILLGPFALTRGTQVAHAVIDGSKYQAVRSDLPVKEPLDRALMPVPFRFLGKLGDRFAVYDPVQNRVSLIAASELKVVTLTVSPYPGPHPEIGATPTASSLSAVSSVAPDAAMPAGASAASAVNSASAAIPSPAPMSVSRSTR